MNQSWEGILYLLLVSWNYFFYISFIEKVVLLVASLKSTGTSGEDLWLVNPGAKDLKVMEKIIGGVLQK